MIAESPPPHRRTFDPPTTDLDPLPGRASIRTGEAPGEFKHPARSGNRLDPQAGGPPGRVAGFNESIARGVDYLEKRAGKVNLAL